MKLGDAFYLQSPFYSQSNRDLKNPHLWFVAHHADDTIVIFNFSSWEEDKDQTCKVRPSEYNQLKHISLVMYEHGLAFSGPVQIKKLLENGVGRMVKSVPNNVLTRVVYGATISERIAPAVQKYFLK